jgi:hypothetical protein
MASIFDFSKVMPGSSRASMRSSLAPFSAQTDMPDPTGGVRLSPAPYAMGVEVQPEAPGLKPASTNLGGSETIQAFLTSSKDTPELATRRKAVIEMIQNGEDEDFITDAIVNKMGIKPAAPKDTIGDMLLKSVSQAASPLINIAKGTASAVTEGAKQIGEGVSQAADIGSADSYRGIPNALLGLGRIVSSPLEGAITGTAKGLNEATPDILSAETKAGIGQKIGEAKQFVERQSPAVQGLVKDVGIGAELGLNILGLK